MISQPNGIQDNDTKNKEIICEVRYNDIQHNDNWYIEINDDTEHE